MLSGPVGLWQRKRHTSCACQVHVLTRQCIHWLASSSKSAWLNSSSASPHNCCAVSRSFWVQQGVVC